MTAEVPTNNFISLSDHLQSVKVSSIGEILSSPSSYFQSSCTSSLSKVGQIQHAISSLDLSLTFPEHPGLEVLGYSLERNTLSGKYSLVMPDLQVSMELILGLAISIAIGIVLAAIIYNFVLSKMEKSTFLNEDLEWKTRSLLIGSLIYFTCIMPYALFDVLGTENTAVRFSLMSPFILYFFRIFEAAFGFVPKGADASVKKYVLYFASPAEIMFDEKATRNDIFHGSIAVMKCAAVMSLLCTLLSPSGYTPFGEVMDFNEPISMRLLTKEHIGNCFAMGFFFQSALALGGAVFGSMVQIFTGYNVMQTMRNPLLEATSPRDFWSKRWNVLVHVVLKRAVYKPVRRYASALIASLAVFFASGLFHEWMVHACFMYKRQSEGVILGSNTAFFVWNFVVIACERMLVSTKGVQYLKRVLPRFMVTVVIVMSSLPFCHWFGGPYLNGNFFPDYELFVPMVRKI